MTVSRPVLPGIGRKDLDAASRINSGVIRDRSGARCSDTARARSAR